jgi:Zn finger protein HypA/HybF involved in hydrogenase expression
MGRRPTRKWTDEELIEAVKTSYSIAQVLRKLKLDVSGANYRLIPMTIKSLNLDTSHFLGRAHLKDKTHNWSSAKPLKEILKENSHYQSSHLRIRLIRENYFKEECSSCLLTNWCGEKIPLQLDHIDGDSTNNKLENLRILCPTCHTLTPTFAGKNIGKTKYNHISTLNTPIEREIIDRSSTKEKIIREKKIYKCERCTITLETTNKYCKDCFPIMQFEINKRTVLTRQQKMIEQGLPITKISWPAPDIIKELIWKKPTVQIANELGVSDKAVEKYCKKHNISKPPRGYWMKSLS